MAFLIERNLSGASQLTPEQLRDIAATCNEVVEGLGPAYWNASDWRKSVAPTIHTNLFECYETFEYIGGLG